MNKNAIVKFMKDIILAAAFYGFGMLLLRSCDFGSAANNMFAPIFIAGIPFGWSWASKVITAMSVKGIGIKLSIALFLGWIAIWVVMIMDLIRCIAALVTRARR